MWLTPVGVSLVAIGVYSTTLAPTVTAEDSGELIAAAWHWGIPHPPGYPLWTMLCGAFIRVVAVGEIAWRANLFSAVCTALAAGIFAATLRALNLHPAACAPAALAWAFSRWTWMQAVITEVYGLNSLLVAGLLFCAVRWRGTRDSRWLIAASLNFGLGMGNHHTIALVALALIIWIIAHQPALLRRWRLILAAFAAFALGLLPYAYLPLRARDNPPMNWGNPSTARAFLNHVTRSQYGAVGPIKTIEPRSLRRFAGQVGYVAGAVRDDLTMPLCVLALAGVAVMARRDRAALGLVMLWLFTTAILFVVISNFDLDRVSRFALRVFLIPVTMGLAVPLAFLLHAMLSAITGRKSSPAVAPASHGSPPSALRQYPRNLLGLALLAAPAWQAVAHWRQCDYSDYYYARDHAENLLRCLLPRALVFPTGDHNTFPLAYLTLVEGVRDDVVIADLYGYTRPDLYADKPPSDPDTPEGWLIRRARRPVYFATKRAAPVTGARFVQSGLLYHLLPDGMDFDSAGLLDQCQYRNHEPGRPTVDDLGAAHINVDYHFFNGLHSLGKGDLARAGEHFASAAQYGEGIKEVFNNLGSALAEHGHPDSAEPYFAQAAALDRHYLVPRWNLYRVAAAREDWPLARVRLLDIIAVDPTDFRAHGQLGYLMAERFADPTAAAQAWRQSLDLNPDQPQIIGEVNKTEPRP